MISNIHVCICVRLQDFFVPGDPREGFSISFQKTKGGDDEKMANLNLGSSKVSFGAPNNFAAGSSDYQESAVWQSTATIETDWDIKMTTTITIRPYDLFFTVNVRITNMNTNPEKKLYNLMVSIFMRDIVAILLVPDLLILSFPLHFFVSI